jgi:hypothetical protein
LLLENYNYPLINKSSVWLDYSEEEFYNSVAFLEKNKHQELSHLGYLSAKINAQMGQYYIKKISDKEVYFEILNFFEQMEKLGFEKFYGNTNISVAASELNLSSFDNCTTSSNLVYRACIGGVCTNFSTNITLTKAMIPAG